MERREFIPAISENGTGYLSTPVTGMALRGVMNWDEKLPDREDTSWPEYSIYQSYAYPEALNELVKLGIAFTWEYEITEDFSYYAYNFPTESNPHNYGIFKTGDKRKKFPRLSNKQIKAIESTSAANWLLYTIGVKPNGTN